MEALISLSGGMDSTTLLAYLIEESGYEKITAVSFFYGSKHNKYENEAAKNVAKYYGVELITINIESVMEQVKSNLLLSGSDIPEGHYAQENMKLTVVPGRNTIFTSILLAIAQSKKINTICLGIHSGDHAIYPDCRPNWAYTMQDVLYYASDGLVSNLYTPFLFMNKTDMLDISKTMSIPVPYHLTRTCYKDQEESCGLCGSCNERLEAFSRAGLTDPIKYQKLL